MGRMPRDRRIRQLRADKSANRRDLAVSELAGAQHGVIDEDDLLRCGLDRQAISVRARNGRLHRLHLGVFAVGHVALSAKGRYLAAVKACRPLAILSHAPAGEIWEYLDEDSRRPPEVTIRGDVHRRRPGIRIHRCIDIRDDEWLVFDRIPITSPMRTIIDLAGVLDESALREALRRAIAMRRVRLATLARVLARTGPRPGIAKLRRLVAAGLPTRSELEDVVLALVLAAGFDRPDVNVPLRLGGRTVIPDLRWPEQRLIVECDGASWHDNAIARADDLERQRLLEAHGERVMRVTWRQAVGHPQGVRLRLDRAGAPGRRPSAHL